MLGPCFLAVKLLFSLEGNGQTLKYLSLYKIALEANGEWVGGAKTGETSQDTVTVSRRDDESL